MPSFSRTDTTLLVAATCVLLSEWALPGQAAARPEVMESNAKPCLSAAVIFTPHKASALPKPSHCKAAFTPTSMGALRGTQ